MEQRKQDIISRAGLGPSDATGGMGFTPSLGQETPSPARGLGALAVLGSLVYLFMRGTDTPRTPERERPDPWAKMERIRARA